MNQLKIQSFENRVIEVVGGEETPQILPQPEDCLSEEEKLEIKMISASIITRNY